MTPVSLDLVHPLPHLTEFRISAASATRTFVLRRLVVWAAITFLGRAFLLALLDTWTLDRVLVLLRTPRTLALVILLAHALMSKTLLSESITPLPSLGVVLSSRSSSTYLPSFISPHSTSQTLIPLDEIIDIVINEGFRRWSIIGYLVILRKDRADAEATIVFPTTLPKTEVLVEVYHGVREILWDEFDDSSDDDGQPASRRGGEPQ